MIYLGYVLLILAFLLYANLIRSLFREKGPGGGDAVVSYIWGLIYTELAIWALLSLTSLIIGWEGGFGWLAESGGGQFGWVALGLLTCAIGSGLSTVSKSDLVRKPLLIRGLYNLTTVITPLATIASGAILLTESLRSSLPVASYQWPLSFAFGLSLLVIANGIWELMQQSNQNAIRAQETALEDQKRYHQMHLDDIKNCDVSKNMVFILVFTDANHSPEVREKALAKIKTNPRWQQELIRLLECDWAPQAFTFLASNEVDDPTLFLEPLRQGMLNYAGLIRKDMRNFSHPSHLHADLYRWDTERMLRAVDRYVGKGVDYLPAVKEVRAALEEPCDFPKPSFQCAALLDRWIESRS